MADDKACEFFVEVEGIVVVLPKNEDVLNEVVAVVLDQMAELFELSSLLGVVGVGGWCGFFVLALVVESTWNDRTSHVFLEAGGLLL